jgi:hypothetical protein
VLDEFLLNPWRFETVATLRAAGRSKGFLYSTSDFKSPVSALRSQTSGQLFLDHHRTGKLSLVETVFL